MKKSLFFVFAFSLLLTVMLVPAAVFAEEEPVKIGTYDELSAFITGINDGTIDARQDAELTADIVVPESVGNNWVPLGKDLEHAYQGTLLCEGHSIKGIKIDRSAAYPDEWTEGVKVESYTAFISFLSETGIVDDLTVEADITDVNCVAGIVSQNAGIISDCKFKGTLNSNIYPNAGSGKSYCYPEGIFDDTGSESGCIAAVNRGMIIGCETLEGTKIHHGGVHCGGIVGSQIEGGTILGCENHADVTVTETTYPVMGVFCGGAGGIAGGQYFSMYFGQEQQAEILLMTDAVSLRYMEEEARDDKHIIVYSKEGISVRDSGGFDAGKSIRAIDTSKTISERKHVIMDMLSKRQPEPLVAAAPYDPNDLPAIQSCQNYGEISCETLAGGICGQCFAGNIHDCENRGNVDNVTRMWGGGIVGYFTTDSRTTGENEGMLTSNRNYAYINPSPFSAEKGIAGMWEGVYIGGIAGEVDDYFDEEGNHVYTKCFDNVNYKDVCGRFGVGGVIGYLVNGVENTDPADPTARVIRVYELANIGHINGSDCVGGVVGACPGAVTDVVNYGAVALYPESKTLYCTAGGVTGGQDSTGVCVSSYSAGSVGSAATGDDPLEPKWLIGGVTGSAGYDQQVAGSSYCYETAPGAIAIVGNWLEENNYGAVKLEDMGGGAAEVGLIHLFDRSESLHKETQWETVENIEKDGVLYYMTPQLSKCPIDADTMYREGVLGSYPVSIAGSRIVTPAATYNGKEQAPTIKVNMGGIELPSDLYDVTIQGPFIEAGKYPITATAKESLHYTGSTDSYYTISKAPQKIKSIKPAKKTVKRGKTFKLKTTVTPLKGHGKITFKKTSGDKKIKVTKSGKVKTSKNLKKGKTSKIKVQVSVAEKKNYAAATKTKTIKVKIK